MSNSKPNLLIENFLFEYDKNIENQDDGSIVVKGIIQRADAENQNHRVYPYDILKSRIDDYMRLIRENRAFGELDHADSPIVGLQKTSHMVQDIWWEGKTVYGKVKIMPTDTGKNLIVIIKCGGVPGISSRALGSVKNQHGVDVVQEDLQIVCWDFVSEPSTHQAFMRLSEAKEYTANGKDKSIITSSSKVERVRNTLTEVLALRK
jgi:hypothetical protein